jgi:phenylacetate-coenzyme A ligase PaaK-like adenylate-forming protein
MSLSKVIFHKKMCLLKKGGIDFYADLKSNEQLSEDRLFELNLKRRQLLVQFAYKTIPFYQKKYKEAGFDLGDVEEENFFEKLPVLEKDDVRQYAEQLIDPNCSFEELCESATGGSTGVPLKVYQDPKILINLISWRTLNWWGVDISDSSGYLYRAVPEGWHKKLQKLVLWPTKRNWISAAEMNLDNMRLFYQRLKRDKAKYIVGYVGAIDAFANFLDNESLSIDSLKVVWTTSSPLNEGKRKYLSEIFDCSIYTQYGSCEFYWISAECTKQNGLHIANDIRHVDVLNGYDPVGRGVFGDLVVTDLLNYKFPLIRYRLGDRGRLLKSKCSCSLPFPMMDYVKGRISDSIICKSGTLIPGEYWTTIFDNYTSEIKSFQVHQLKDYSIKVKYEANTGFKCNKIISEIEEKLRQKLGAVIELSFEETQVDINDNGKTRFVISDIKR